MTGSKRWKLQVYWGGGWRTIMESDKRQDLVQYAESCPADLELRIIDATEEVKSNGRRH